MKSNKNYISEMIAEKGYINGIYAPWFSGEWYGRDIGSSIHYGYKDTFFNPKYIELVFTNCKAIGFDMVKIWLNEGEEGILYDDKGSVVGVEPMFFKNLRTVFETAEKLELPLSICLVAHEECSFKEDKSLYDKHNRYKQIPEETEKYIENWVKPILNMANEFKCVKLVDLYAEPEAEGRIWMVTRGAKWEVIVRFINRINQVVKEVNPMFATTVSSGASDGTLKGGKYCNFEVDYVGADIYSPTGSYADPSEFFCTKPFMLGEYGFEGNPNPSIDLEDAFVELYKKFQKRIKETNTVGAFWWCYGLRNNHLEEE